MEEGICFSLYSLKLNILFLWYLSLAIVKDREMLKYIFMHLKPRLNTSGCVYGRIVILKNYIIIKKQLDHRMNLLT
jgi:hypothetical protein